MSGSGSFVWLLWARAMLIAMSNPKEGRASQLRFVMIFPFIGQGSYDSHRSEANSACRKCELLVEANEGAVSRFVFTPNESRGQLNCVAGAEIIDREHGDCGVTHAITRNYLYPPLFQLRQPAKRAFGVRFAKAAEPNCPVNSPGRLDRGGPRHNLS